MPRFEFLKCFLVDPSMQSMEIEAFHIEFKPEIQNNNQKGSHSIGFTMQTNLERERDTRTHRV